MPAGSAPRHAAQARLGLQTLRQGIARTKQEAVQLAGLGRDALAPSSLAPLIARSPDMRASLSRGRMLDMTTDCDGETVSMGKALAGCAEAALRTLARVGRRADQAITREESQALSRAKMLIGLARECGLWDETPHDSLPGELQRLAEAESLAMSPDHWARDWSRTDGVGPTMRKLRALEVAQTDSDPPTPGEIADSATS